jgi:hypothetical protein
LVRSHGFDALHGSFLSREYPALGFADGLG